MDICLFFLFGILCARGVPWMNVIEHCMIRNYGRQKTIWCAASVALLITLAATQIMEVRLPHGRFIVMYRTASITTIIMKCERDPVHDQKLWTTKNTVICSECNTPYYAYAHRVSSLIEWRFYCYTAKCPNSVAGKYPPIVYTPIIHSIAPPL